MLSGERQMVPIPQKMVCSCAVSTTRCLTVVCWVSRPVTRSQFRSIFMAENASKSFFFNFLERSIDHRKKGSLVSLKSILNGTHKRSFVFLHEPFDEIL